MGDAAHAGNIDEVAGARSEAPGPGGLDRAGRLKRLDALARLRGGKPAELAVVVGTRPGKPR